MKILYLVHQFYPMHYTGTEKFVLNLASTMQAWAHKVKVATCSFYEDNFYDKDAAHVLSKDFLYKNLHVLAYKQKRPPVDQNWGVANSSLISYAESVLQEYEPDVLHLAHGMRTSEFAFAAKRLRIPYIVTMTDFFLICPKCILFTSDRKLCNGPERGIACAQSCPEFETDYIKSRLRLGEQILRDAACVVAPSRFLGSVFKHEYDYIEPRVIPYGIDFSKIKRNLRTYDGSAELTFLFAGQVDYHKGVHVLIDAFIRVRGNIRLKIYGSGPDASVRRFREMARDDKRIEFCGVYPEDKLGEIFGAVDVAVIPSNWHENNTIVMREALASNLPCIVSNAEGMIEKIQDGVNGFIFRMGDADQLKDILEKLIANPRILQEMKRNLHTYALTTVEQEAYAYMEEYQKISVNDPVQR